jgi:nucleoside phosphorylase
MQLITMAHIGEAQSLIEVFGMKEIKPHLFSNENFLLLITGEGPIEALTRTALTIPTMNITEIVNVGIAGALSDDLKVGDIVPVRTIYLVQDLKPQFKTFQSFEKGHDCITSFERILDPAKTEKLKGIGHLVDREAWGVAMAAKSSGIPFKSIKLISDVAGSIEACELVREKAQEFGSKLAEISAQNLNLEKSPQVFELQGFHFTFTSRHRVLNLLHKLSLKKGLTQDEALKILPLHELKSLEVSPKEKTKKLIESLEDQLDPKRKFINSRLETLNKNFEKKGLRLQTDPQLERPKVTISFEAGSDLELKEKLQALESLSLKDFSALMNGELDVE